MPLKRMIWGYPHLWWNHHIFATLSHIVQNRMRSMPLSFTLQPQRFDQFHPNRKGIAGVFCGRLLRLECGKCRQAPEVFCNRTHPTISRIMLIWGYPEMGVPLNHQSWYDFPYYKPINHQFFGTTFMDGRFFFPTVSAIPASTQNRVATSERYDAIAVKIHGLLGVPPDCCCTQRPRFLWDH